MTEARDGKKNYGPAIVALSMTMIVASSYASRSTPSRPSPPARHTAKIGSIHELDLAGSSYEVLLAERRVGESIFFEVIVPEEASREELLAVASKLEARTSPKYPHFTVGFHFGAARNGYRARVDLRPQKAVSFAPSGELLPKPPGVVGMPVVVVDEGFVAAMSATAASIDTAQQTANPRPLPPRPVRKEIPGVGHFCRYSSYDTDTDRERCLAVWEELETRTGEAHRQQLRDWERLEREWVSGGREQYERRLSAYLEEWPSE